MNEVLDIVAFVLTFLCFLVLGFFWIEYVMKSKNNEKPFHFWSSMWAFLFFSCFVFVVWLAAAWGMPQLYKGPNGVGEAGDMFGGVTALFSGLAFAGLISTLLMQRRELELQRDELTASREEFSLQRFENTLFGLLKMFNDHVVSLTAEVQSFVTPIQLKGREVLRYFARELQDGIYTFDYDHDDNGDAIPLETTRSLKEQQDSYVQTYQDTFEPDLGPYFRLLYNTIRTIEESSLTNEEKVKYSKIVRAYLSSSEVKLLMFNCSTFLGEDFRGWVVKYKLLKHLHPGDADANRNLVNSYPSEAFKNRFEESEKS